MRTIALFVLWCVLLVLAYRWNPDPEALHLPISMFRDGERPELGYMLFASLIATVASHALTCWIRRERLTCSVCLLVIGGLVLIGATHTHSFAHNVIALVVIAFGYLYFTVSLYREFLEWNDPFLRSIHRRGMLELDIPLRDRKIAHIWQCVIVFHQGILLLGLIGIVALWGSGGLFQKFMVTHMLMLMGLLEVLPRRRASPMKRSRRTPVE